MKKNRRKKKKGDHGSPRGQQHQDGFLPLRVRFNDLLRSKAGESPEPPGFQILVMMLIIWGTVKKGNGGRFSTATKLSRNSSPDCNDYPALRRSLCCSLDADKFEEQAETLRKIVEELKGEGTCCYGCCNDEENRDPCYVFVGNGVILKKVDQGRKGAIVALSRKMAMKFVAKVQTDLGMTYSIADVRAVYDSTLPEQLVEWCKAGDDCVFVIRKVEDKFIDYEVVVPLEQPDAE